MGQIKSLGGHNGWTIVCYTPSKLNFISLSEIKSLPGITNVYENKFPFFKSKFLRREGVVCIILCNKVTKDWILCDDKCNFFTFLEPLHMKIIS